MSGIHRSPHHPPRSPISHLLQPNTVRTPSLRGAKRRSNPALRCRTGLLRCARNDERNRSRGAICARGVVHACKKGPSNKSEGSGAPEGAPVSGPHPFLVRVSLQGGAARVRRGAGLASYSSRLRGRSGGGPLAFRRSTAVVPAWAAPPGITGCKREDPPRCQCSEHLAVRSRAGRDVAQNRPMRNANPLREPLPLRLRTCLPGGVPR